MHLQFCILGWVCILGIVGGSPVGKSNREKNLGGHKNIWRAMNYVYYRGSKEWYSPQDIGTQGPCSDNMVFLRYKSRPYRGTCRCAQKADVPLLYKSGKCYPIFSQGPCKVDEWIVQVNRMVACAPNPCSNIYASEEGERNSTMPLVDVEGFNCVEYKSKCQGNFQWIAQLDRNGTYVVECKPEPEYSNAYPEVCDDPTATMTIHLECPYSTEM